ncbi:MarR family winged helix-turn-helix transcriptional regulator [Paracoccus aerodenitrificans]|uniref:MarR family winged helix-turn-helix transcriptional regulator n=1 Tax=Paracoccus aerodenitrificans TaxID=3017781 RepID=UPI0022F0E17C|nr:MarR family transcriptional regulator [Paracoccus aerodenitrificans]WBU64186.1 MarR family transcriptional regulator [Paracoccus aerodenitrificans]
MDTLGNLPGHMIRRLHQLAVSAFATETREAGFELTPVQYGSLLTLAQREGIDQATLAGLVAYDRVTIGGVVSRLESRGYLTREVREEDRRARLLRLTERGESVVQTIKPAVRAAQARILAPLEPEEQEEFMRLLKKVTAGLEGRDTEEMEGDVLNKVG